MQTILLPLQKIQLKHSKWMIPVLIQSVNTKKTHLNIQAIETLIISTKNSTYYNNKFENNKTREGIPGFSQNFYSMYIKIMLKQ